MTNLKQRYSELHPAFRWVICLLGILLAILLVLQLLLSFFVDEYAANRLKKMVQQANQGAYHLEFEDLDINLFTGSASLHNLHLSTDSSFTTDTSGSEQQNTLRIHVKDIDIQGVNYWSYFKNKRLSIGSITFQDPTLTAVLSQPSEQKKKKTSFSIDSLIYSKIKGRLRSLQLDQLIVQDGHLTAINKNDTADTLASIGRLNLKLNSIRVDSATVQSGRWFITDKINLGIDEAFMHVSSDLYTLRLGKLKVSSSRQTIQIDSLRLIPRYPKFVFGQKKGVEIDRIDLIIPKINILEVDFTQWTHAGRFHAQKLVINHAKMVDFRNKNLPFPSNQHPPLPHLALRELDAQLKIDTIQVKDAFISYSEYWYNTPQAGTLTFEHVNATLHKVTNYPKLMKRGVTIVMDARAQVMGKGLLKTHFEFPMDTQNGFHKIKGSLGKIPIPAFNPMLQYVAFIRADEGMLNHMEFSMTLNDTSSTGTLVMNYENFKISLLDKKTMKQQGIVKDAGSFLANALVIKENNTPKEGMRTGRIQFKRLQHKSVFNYWWKSLLSGIKDSIGM